MAEEKTQQERLIERSIEMMDAATLLIRAFGSFVRAKAIAQNDENARRKECRSKEGSGV